MVGRSLVVQSYRQSEVPEWLHSCLASVRHWALQCEYDYRFCGDELLARVPDWYAEKVGDRTPIMADLARLKWIQEILLEEDYHQVIWLDADTLVFAPHHLRVDMQASCVFGREHWLQRDGRNRQRVYKNVHNAFCAFRRDSPVLGFLIESIERMVERVDGAFIAPQFVGPKLLTSLHNIVGFPTDDRFGAVSPLHAELILAGQDPLSVMATGLPAGQRICAANLCLSLSDEIDHARVVAALLDTELKMHRK